jgi:hypothetical protein
LAAPIRAGSSADFIKQTLQFALQRLMDMDVETLCRAAYGACGAGPLASGTPAGLHLRVVRFGPGHQEQQKNNADPCRLALLFAGFAAPSFGLFPCLPVPTASPKRNSSVA